MQNSILTLFLTLTGIITLVFVMVFLSSKNADANQTGMKNALQKRLLFLLILFVALAILASVTLPKSPYYQYKDEQPAKVVHVAAGQFYFLMSHNAIDPAAPNGEPSVELPANELVEFRVTSLDVNHDFAIYNANNKLVTQTQAMPGYVNSLRWKFKDPGQYVIYCLEYCGPGHQIMKSTFTVK